MEPSSLFTFIGASVLLTLAPGPDILFVIGQGIAHGTRAAMLTALGLCSGLLAHTTAAALGVSAVFHTSALAFQSLKLAGAAYLLYLAWKTVRASGEGQADDTPRLPAATLFRRGIVMNLLNPKVSLFFLAFLPQFVSADGNIPAQMALLGLIFITQALAVFCAVSLFAGRLGPCLLQHPSFSRLSSWLSASIFAALGIRLALAQR